MKKFKMTEDEYRENVNDYNGFCLACGECRFGETEGDARNYPCESCEENKVFGTEELLVMGLIEII